jgi:ABC-type branched-subunit amino acid transport system ATPase component
VGAGLLVERFWRKGVAVLLIEQRAVEAAAVADWVHVMVGRRLRVSEPASKVASWEDIGQLFLGAQDIT